MRVERNEAQRQQAIALMGATACGPCPAMRLGKCPGKVSEEAPCPPQAVEPAINTMPERTSEMSYRAALMDDSCDIVIADLQQSGQPLASNLRQPVTTTNKKVTAQPSPRRTSSRSSGPVARPQQARRNMRPTQPDRSTRRRRDGEIGHAIAEVVGMMFMPAKSS